MCSEGKLSARSLTTEAAHKARRVGGAEKQSLSHSQVTDREPGQQTPTAASVPQEGQWRLCPGQTALMGILGICMVLRSAEGQGKVTATARPF